MKVAIIGATGFVGRRVVDEALARGIQVTAIARQNKDLPEHAHLTVALGDVADTAWLAGQLRGQDAVISAYNPGWGEDHLYEKTVRGAQQILTAVEQAGVKRLLVVGGAGSLEVAPGLNWWIRRSSRKRFALALRRYAICATNCATNRRSTGPISRRPPCWNRANAPVSSASAPRSC